MSEERYLIYGKTGWIGGKMAELCTKQGKTWQFGDARLESREAILRDMDSFKPTHVLNAAGVTGRPNVDWCESHRQETLRANVIGVMNLSDICETRGVHCTLFATGCIFEFDDTHPMPAWDPATKQWSKSSYDQMFNEEDNANFTGSYYSYTKGMVEQMLKEYKNTCVLRVRMPISDDLSPRNFVTKITFYERVVNIPNSMTTLTDMLPAAMVCARKRLSGIYNFTNPGCISHNQILDLYAEYIDPDFTYTNFTIEEQDKILASKRSNNELDTRKLVEAVKDEIDIPDIHAAMRLVFQRMKENLAKEGNLPPKGRKRQKLN